MKISEQPTNHILVKAYTGSEWDCCDFAIINCDNEWAKLLRKRIGAARILGDDQSFFKTSYWDCSVSFYRSDGEFERDEILPADREWAFVELEEGEDENFTEPESSLDCYMQVVYKNSSGRYTAYGKHTSEEFWTDDIPFEKIIETML